jgi:hypothetical protein
MLWHVGHGMGGSPAARAWTPVRRTHSRTFVSALLHHDNTHNVTPQVSYNNRPALHNDDFKEFCNSNGLAY